MVEDEDKEDKGDATADAAPEPEAAPLIRSKTNQAGQTNRARSPQKCRRALPSTLARSRCIGVHAPFARRAIIWPAAGRQALDTARSAGAVSLRGAQNLAAGRYTVARGDTLSLISLKHYQTSRYYLRIYRANREIIRNPNLIYPCQRLYLPRRPG